MSSEKIHTTNYINTFIEVADDCPAAEGEAPPVSEREKSVARLQYEMLVNKPYHYSSDDVIFKVFALRNDIVADELESQRMQFFSKGQACFRSSPLTKRYGWGVHSNDEGKIAIFGRETVEYEKFLIREDIKRVKGMRSSKK